MKKRIISIALCSAIFMSTVAVAVAAAGSVEPVTLSLANDEALQVSASARDEHVLVLRGDWAKERKYQLDPIVNGEHAQKGDVYWSVDADSYKNEFGFSGELTGADIVSVNEETGEITAQNSGVVRVVCASREDPETSASVIVVVPGDVNKDGVVDSRDADWVAEVAIGDVELPAVRRGDPEAMFVKELADMSGDGKINMMDVDYLDELVSDEKNI